VKLFCCSVLLCFRCLNVKISERNKLRSGFDNYQETLSDVNEATNFLQLSDSDISQDKSELASIDQKQTHAANPF
jgi:hypothetical protein